MMPRHGFGYYAKTYFMMMSQDIKSKMQYRADFYISSLGMLAMNALGLLSFWILFKSIPDIQGWNYNQMVFLYGFSLLALTPLQLFFDNIWQTSHKVLRGDFIIYCLRPVNIFFYFVAEVFDMKGLTQLAFGGVILTYAWVKLGLPFTVPYILLLLLALIGASLVMAGIMVLASASAFWITNSMSLLTFVSKFRDYAKYPMTIFNTLFKFIFSFLIPIGFIAFYPSQLFLKPDEAPVLALMSPLVGTAFFILGYLVWMKGAKAYSGTGS